MNKYIPAIIVVASNTLYHICARSTPEKVNTFAALTVTYTVAALASLLMFFVTRGGDTLAAQLRELNWASFALGLAIIGLEAGFLLMYKVGWTVSTAQIVTGAALGVVLIFVGGLLFKETITASKLAGILICIIGLYFINR